MPLIKVQTSVAQPDAAQVEQLLTQLSASLARHTGKPESYVMTIFEADVTMTFGATFDPTCYIEIKNIGALPQAKAMSQDFCQQVEDALGVTRDRTYIEFSSAQGSMWGWNGSTFG